MYRALHADAGKAAAALSEWKNKMRREWPQIHIRDVQLAHPDRTRIQVGEKLTLHATVDLGAVDPSEVSVQAYYGENRENAIVRPTILALDQFEKTDRAGTYTYSGVIPSQESGAFGFSVRVVPTHPHLTQEHELRLITWA